MNRRVFFTLFFTAAVSVLCLGACNDPDKQGNNGADGGAGGADASSATSRVYVLCEGLYGMNNTTLFGWNVKDGTVETNLFRKANARGMGDTGNDLLIYGSKMYAAVNGSNLVEVMDVHTARSLKQIPLVNEKGAGRQPRCLCACNGYIYVSNFDNTVCRIDTALLEVEAVATVGRNPEGLCVAAGKLYVCNSGGLDYPAYDSTVSVVDLQSFREIKRIAVGRNPYKAAVDSCGYVYISTRGNYNGLRAARPEKTERPEDYNFYRIDPATDLSVQTYNIPVLNFCISGRECFFYHYDYKEGKGGIKVMDLPSGRIINECFAENVQTPYAVAVDPYTGRVFISDGYNYLRSGSFYVYSRSGGTPLYSFHAVGLNPSSFAFVR